MLGFTSPYYPEQGEREEDFAGERGVGLVRGAIGVPDLPVEITNVSSWEVAGWVAERFQQGNVFLVGDAAHVMPPSGGFGANTGIADAYNLAWKLALVFKGIAAPGLLSTYTEERQPVVCHTVEQALLMFQLFYANKNSSQIVSYNSVAFGYRYHSSAIPSDPEDHAWFEDFSQPTGRPGTHSAHVMLESNGQRFSTLDLFGKHFVLLTGAEGGAWCEAARNIAARLGLQLSAYRIGSRGDFVDPDDCFFAVYGVQPGGAVLVRPDGFVGWRAEVADEQPERTLEKAFACLLGRASVLK
jgi:putative polyketide hydroxylase